MPVFVAEKDEGGDTPDFFVAARGHHADLGGIAPGSMPPGSRSIDDEGILFDNMLIVDDGNFRDADVHAHLTTGDWPARNPALNIADLKAQVAACQRGASALADLLRRARRKNRRRLYGARSAAGRSRRAPAHRAA